MGEMVYRVKMPIAVIDLWCASPRPAKKYAYGICNTEASEKAWQSAPFQKANVERHVPFLSTAEPRDAQPLLVPALKV